METEQDNSQEIQNQPTVSVGDWVLTIFISGLPLIGLIMLFVWGFGSDTPVNKANWAKATLIWYAIGIVFVIIFFMAFGAIIFSNLDSFA